MTNEKRFHHSHITKLTFNVYSFDSNDWKHMRGDFGCKIRVSSTGKLVYIDNCTSTELFEDIKQYGIEQGIIKSL